MGKSNLRRNPLVMWFTDDELKLLRSTALDGFAIDDVLEFTDSQREEIYAEFIRDLVFEALDPNPTKQESLEGIPLSDVDHLNSCLERSVESALDGHNDVSDLLDNSEDETR